MILTYSLKHGRDFGEPGQAKKTAGFAIRTKSNTGRDARHIGLIRNCKPDPAKVQEHRIKKATNVKPAIQDQPIKYDSTAKTAGIPCLGLELDCSCLPGFQKIRQVGIGKKIAHISVQVQKPKAKGPEKFIGVDCNTTGHAAVAALPHTGKIHKPGKMAVHTHAKYRQARKRLQRHGRFLLLKKIKNRAG